MWWVTGVWKTRLLRRKPYWLVENLRILKLISYKIVLKALSIFHEV
jgi:hypothetical protein